jgi:hypothetical protein
MPRPVEPGAVDDALIDARAHVLEATGAVRLEESAHLRQQEPVFPVASAAEGIQPCGKAPTRRLGGFTFNPARHP